MHSHCLNASDDVISNTRPSSRTNSGASSPSMDSSSAILLLKCAFRFSQSASPACVRETSTRRRSTASFSRSSSPFFSRLPSTAATREVVMLSLLLSSPAVIFFFVPLCKSRITAISPHRLALKRFSRASRGCSSSRRVISSVSAALPVTESLLLLTL